MGVSIDVIVPLYKGQKYIEKQIEQIDKAAQNVDARITLCFSNDDPNEKVGGADKTDNITIKYINTDKNNGIQVARIRGLESLDGEFVHFLDQDDIINEYFYKKQLEIIGNADAAYCGCLNGNHLTYNNDRVLETAFKRENILTACPVISPGQVLIRRKSIPDFWKNNILKNICADDYLLWLSMYALNCSFVPNQEILFQHVRNGDNYSSDILKNYKSDEEVVNLLVASGMFSTVDCEILRRTPEKLLLKRYTPQRKDQIVLQFLSMLLTCYENGRTLDNYFLDKNISKVAIFGAAVMGEKIKGLLKNTGVSVICFIDRNAEYIKEDIPVYTLEQTKFDFDAVILSQIDREDVIEEELREYSDIRTFRIREIVGELLDEC
jgi:glycosyltransferase involved in cell wall biosynthesis